MSLLFAKQQPFRLVQIKSICRQQNKYNLITGMWLGENVSHQHFLLFTKCFQKDSSSGLLKLEIVW